MDIINQAKAHLRAEGSTSGRRAIRTGTAWNGTSERERVFSGGGRHPL